MQEAKEQFVANPVHIPGTASILQGLMCPGFATPAAT